MSKAALPSVFFPERMNRVEIISPLQSAYYVIKCLAEQGHVEFTDINSGTNSVNKRYTETYMECEEADRSLRYIEQHLKAYNKLPISPTYDEFARELSRYDNMNRQEVFQEISTFDIQLHEKVQLYQQLVRQAHQRKMRLEALRFFMPIIDQETSIREQMRRDSSAMELGILGAANLILSVTGFVPNDQVRRLITTACRATRRNVAYQTGVTTGEVTPYTFFVSSPDMLSLLLKICESFGPDVFDFPSDVEKLEEIKVELEAEIQQMGTLDQQTSDLNMKFLDEISEHFWNWRLFVAREKQIWMGMDYGDFSRDESSVVYTGWTPVRYSNELPLLLQKATEESGSPVPVQLNLVAAEQCMDKEPPTYIQTNSFSYTFQLLNNAYGIPNYDELNGGAFYAMYPFLFAIMFGDIGHSLFYIILTLALFIMEPIMKKRGRVQGLFAMAFKYKWLLFFASFCSFYTGLIYNDCFGLPIYFFKSNWKKVEPAPGSTIEHWERIGKKVYPFGIDAEWLHKDNELIFLNSYKMKLSVVMGMCQMVVGMILQLINHIHRKDAVHLFLCWLPEMLYLIPFFGYMVVLILKKWLTDFPANKEGIFNEDTSEHGVNIIQILIAMLLEMGKEVKDLHLYKGQWNIQLVITILFIISIPMLLFGKPIYDFIKHHKDPGFSVLEIFVMNLIHVIEFCLSALSHLASYLRLWALSLAHSQLSHVLWDELFLLEINMSKSMNWLVLFVSFAGFAVMTVAILLGMEAFSALLHGIRLMWVEFSSKFYEGMGNAFRPLSLWKQVKGLGLPHH